MSFLRSTVLVICLGLFGFNSIAEQRGKYWYVQSGDTLYGIGRAVFPSSISSQSKLRSQLIKLNQDVFKKGAGSLYVGAKLVLPDFAIRQNLKSSNQVVIPSVIKTKGLSISLA